MRIVSLLPSATEILYALGVGDQVVGITHECDFPPEVAGKAALIKPRVDPNAAPAEIDRQVSELCARRKHLRRRRRLARVPRARPDHHAGSLPRMRRIARRPRRGALPIRPAPRADAHSTFTRRRLARHHSRRRSHEHKRTRGTANRRTESESASSRVHHGLGKRAYVQRSASHRIRNGVCERAICRTIRHVSVYSRLRRTSSRRPSACSLPRMARSILRRWPLGSGDGRNRRRGRRTRPGRTPILQSISRRRRAKQRRRNSSNALRLQRKTQRTRIQRRENSTKLAKSPSHPQSPHLRRGRQ